MSRGCRPANHSEGRAPGSRQARHARGNRPPTRKLTDERAGAGSAGDHTWIELRGTCERSAGGHELLEQCKKEGENSREPMLVTFERTSSTTQGEGTARSGHQATRCRQLSPVRQWATPFVAGVAPCRRRLARRDRALNDRLAVMSTVAGNGGLRFCVSAATRAYLNAFVEVVMSGGCRPTAIPAWRPPAPFQHAAKARFASSKLVQDRLVQVTDEIEDAEHAHTEGAPVGCLT